MNHNAYLYTQTRAGMYTAASKAYNTSARYKTFTCIRVVHIGVYGERTKTKCHRNRRNILLQRQRIELIRPNPTEINVYSAPYVLRMTLLITFLSVLPGFRKKQGSCGFNIHRFVKKL